MTFRNALVLVAAFAMLSLAGCKDKDGDSAASLTAPVSAVLSA